MSRRILDEAARLFYEDGFPATSVRKITAACGVTAGSLYNHYGSKEEVLYAILKRAHEDSEALLEEGLLHGGDRPDRQLAELVRELTLFHTERRIEGLVARTEWRHLPPEPAREVLDAQRRGRRIFERGGGGGRAPARVAHDLLVGHREQQRPVEEVVAHGLGVEPVGLAHGLDVVTALLPLAHDEDRVALEPRQLTSQPPGELGPLQQDHSLRPGAGPPAPDTPRPQTPGPKNVGGDAARQPGVHSGGGS